MLKIFCTRIGPKYGWEYVTRLASMFHRHLKLPFHFVCTSDDLSKARFVRDVQMTFLRPRRTCHGWWNLQEAYSHPIWAEGYPIIYAGLDTVITRDITDVVLDRIKQNRLTLMHDFQCLLPKSQRNPLYADTYADGVAFVPSDGVPYLWNAFCEQIPKDSPYPMHVFNTQIMKERGEVPDFWQDIAPDFLCSYKWPTVKTECPKEAIVCFHGDPRPAQAAEETPWIKEHWRE